MTERESVERGLDVPRDEPPPAVASSELNRQPSVAVAERFRAVGASFGRVVARRMLRDTRHVIRELVGDLERDLQALRDGRVRLGTLSTGATAERTGPHASPAPTRSEARTRSDAATTPAAPDWERLSPLLFRLHQQLVDATQGWNEVVAAVASMHSQIAAASPQCSEARGACAAGLGDGPATELPPPSERVDFEGLAAMIDEFTRRDGSPT